MASDFWAALCLVLVIEGLFLFAAPGAWKRVAAQLQELGDASLRRYGGFMVIAGLVLLQFVR